MGKRKDMENIPLEELRHLDHAVFGNLIIAKQSYPEIKEASMFIENPKSRRKKLEKSKSDNAMVIQRQTQRTTFQRSESLSSRESVSTLRHVNGVKPSENTTLKQWHSAEFRTVEGQKEMALTDVSKPVTNGHDNSQHSLDTSNSSEDLNNGGRKLLIYKRKPVRSHGSSSLSRGSSIEEEIEGDEESVTNKTRRRVSNLVDELLLDIYGKWYGNGTGLSFNRRRHSTNSSAHESDCCSTTSVSWKLQSYQPVQGSINNSLQRVRLSHKSIPELEALVGTLRSDVQYAGSLLVRQLKRRDTLISRRDKQNDVITAFLQALSEKRSQDTRIRFSVMPYPGDSGFTQWHDAMKMVARLPGGIPPEFRRRLWLTLAEKHLQARGVDWSHAERFCFNEWSNPDDDELGVQIVKDLHRTGCSLFCGAAAEENQALLKRVLLAYARWNKAVGYCQGFNMLAALILQVMDRSETDSVKVMIYLIEGVLPESYFANNLRGLSVDMAVFRDLLRLRLPTLSRHLEQLQHDARDSATGTSYEPPLTNVFTMQWFLTLFSNCLPQPTVLRVWDLIFLEGNEVLLRTALAIWDGLADRIMAVDSADEFYSIMGVLTREMLEFGLMDTNNLVKTVVTIAPFPFPELPELRDKYLYNITPWTHTVSTAARRGLRLFYSDDDDDGTDEDDEKIAVAAAYGISAVFRSPRRRDSLNRAPSPSSSLSAINYSAPHDRDRLALDISALKQQYAKLRERQRQAHIILTAACARQPLGLSAPNPVAMNHLLLGKSALLSVRGRRSGPPPGAIPPPANIALKSAPKSHKGRQHLHTTSQAANVEVVAPQQQAAKSSGETLHWKDAAPRKQRRGSQQDISTEDMLVPGIPVPIIKEPGPNTDDVEDGTGTDDSKSSTSTELCDEPDRLSDFDSEEPTSVSDASSYVPSAPEAIVTKLPSPSSTDRSNLPTPETTTAPLSPLGNEVSLLPSIASSHLSEFLSESNFSPEKQALLTLGKLDTLQDTSNLKEIIESPSKKEVSLPTVDVSVLEVLSPSKEKPEFETLRQTPLETVEATSQSVTASSPTYISTLDKKSISEIISQVDSSSLFNKTEIPTKISPGSFIQSEQKTTCYDQSYIKEDKDIWVPKTMEDYGSELYKNISPSDEVVHNICTKLKSAVINTSSMFETTQDNWECLQNADNLSTSIQPLNERLVQDDSRTVQQNIVDIPVVLMNEVHLESPAIQIDSSILEDESVSVDDSENVSKLLEMNQRLHEREQGIRDQLCEEVNIEDSEIAAKMTELLELDHDPNLGRRNSERALKIIQENSEILLRIMQCQARRPSKLSEEESNGGTATIPSEAESIPTSSSAENVDITLCKTDVLKDSSANHTVESDTNKQPSEVSFPPPPSIATNSVYEDMLIIVSPEYPVYEERTSPELSEKEETEEIKITELPNTRHYSFPSMPEEFLKKYEFSESNSAIDEKQLPILSSTKSFVLSPETPNNKDHRFSLNFEPVETKVEPGDIKKMLHLVDEKFQPPPENKTFSEPVGYSSSYYMESRIRRPSELELDTSVGSDWKKFPTLDKCPSECQSTQFPKHQSPEHPSTRTSYRSYDTLHFLDSPVLPITETKPVTSVRWTDDSYDFKTSKHFRQIRSTSPNNDSNSSKFSTLSWLSEKPKIKDDDSAFDFLSRPSYSTYSSRYEFSPTRESNTNTYKEILSKESITRPSDGFMFKSSSDKIEISPLDDDPQKPSYSSRRQLTEDFQYSFSLDTTSTLNNDLNGVDQDVTHRTSVRDQKVRPHSTIISDIASIDILNRSYSSSSIDGYLTKTRKDFILSPNSPDRESFLSSFKTAADESLIHASDKNKSRVCSPIFETDSPVNLSSATAQYSLSSISPGRSEFDSKFPSKDLSPTSHSSKWNNDDLTTDFRSIKGDSKTEFKEIYSDALTHSTDSPMLAKPRKSYSPTISPSKSKDIHISLPPIKSSSLSSPTRSKSKFDPFPPRPTMRQPKELGIKLGLYSAESTNRNGKTSKNT